MLYCARWEIRGSLWLRLRSIRPRRACTSCVVLFRCGTCGVEVMTVSVARMRCLDASLGPTPAVVASLVEPTLVSLLDYGHQQPLQTLFGFCKPVQVRAKGRLPAKPEEGAQHASHNTGRICFSLQGPALDMRSRNRVALHREAVRILDSRMIDQQVLEPLEVGRVFGEANSL